MCGTETLNENAFANCVYLYRPPQTNPTNVTTLRFCKSFPIVCLLLPVPEICLFIEEFQHDDNFYMQGEETEDDVE